MFKGVVVEGTRDGNHDGQTQLSRDRIVNMASMLMDCSPSSRLVPERTCITLSQELMSGARGRHKFTVKQMVNWLDGLDESYKRKALLAGVMPVAMTFSITDWIECLTDEQLNTITDQLLKEVGTAVPPRRLTEFLDETFGKDVVDKIADCM